MTSVVNWVVLYTVPVGDSRLANVVILPHVELMFITFIILYW